MTQADALPWMDLALLGAGLLYGGVALGRQVISGAARGWLAEAELRASGPRLPELTIVILVMLLSAIVISQTIAPPGRTGPPTPGSGMWHTQQAAFGIVSLMTAGLCLIVLRTRPTFTPPLRRADEATELLAPPAAPARILIECGRGLLAAFALTPLTIGLSLAAHAAWEWVDPQREVAAHPVLEALQRSEWGGWGLIALAAGAVVVAPLFEELLFRGLILQTILTTTRSTGAAIVVSGIGFGILHGERPADVPPLIFLGVALGILRVRGRALLPCIVAHAAFNARTMLLACSAPELLQAQ